MNATLDFHIKKKKVDTSTPTHVKSSSLLMLKLCNKCASDCYKAYVP